MSTVQMADHTNPCGPPPEPVSQQNTSYVLLQKVDKVPITVTSCKITRIIIPYYCSVWSHSVLSPDFFRFQESVTLTPDKCEELWNNPTFTDTQGRHHPLHLNSITKIYYNEVGDTKHTAGLLGATATGSLGSGALIIGFIVQPVADFMSGEYDFSKAIFEEYPSSKSPDLQDKR